MKIPAAISKFLQPQRLLKPLQPILRRHYFFAGLALLGVLIVSVYLVSQALQAPTDETYAAEQASASVPASFDQNTIGKIEQLQRSSDQASGGLNFPSGTRTNPFAE